MPVFQKEKEQAMREVCGVASFLAFTILGDSAPAYKTFEQAQGPLSFMLERITSIAEGGKIDNLVQAQDQMMCLASIARYTQSSSLVRILQAANIQVAGEDLMSKAQFFALRPRWVDLLPPEQLPEFSLRMLEQKLILLPIQKGNETYYASYQAAARLKDELDLLDRLEKQRDQQK